MPPHHDPATCLHCKIARVITAHTGSERVNVETLVGPIAQVLGEVIGSACENDKKRELLAKRVGDAAGIACEAALLLFEAIDTNSSELVNVGQLRPH